MTQATATAESSFGESSGDTALAVCTPQLQDEWGPVEAECASLTHVVGQLRFSRMSRNACRQADTIIALGSEKEKKMAEIGALKGDLAAANAIVRAERAMNEQVRQPFEKAQDTSSHLYKEKACLADERDIARAMAEESAAVQRKSDDHNKELFCKIAAREYNVCQAKLVLEEALNFTLQTGHSPEQWNCRARVLMQELLALRH